MDKIIRDLTEATAPTLATLVEIQQSGESVTKKMTVGNLTSLEATARAGMDSAIINGAGLDSEGGCSYNNTYYLDGATSLKEATETLDSRLRSAAAAIATSPVVIIEVEVSEAELISLNTYKKKLIEFGTPVGTATQMYLPVACAVILYQTGNALSYGEDLYIGYDSGGDPAIQTAERIWKIPQTFVENSGGVNVACLPQQLVGGTTITSRIQADLILHAPTSNHSGGVITSTMKIVIAYKSISVTEDSLGT